MDRRQQDDGLEERLQSDFAYQVEKELSLRYQVLIEQIPELIFVYDRYGEIYEVSNYACDFFGYSKEEILSFHITDLEKNFDLSSLQHVWDSLEPGMSTILYGYKKRKDGTDFPVEIRINCFLWKSEKRFLSISHDISERAEIEERLLYLTNHDDLTDLYNRRFFELALAQVDLTENMPISIIMADINGLRLVNDSIGYDAGDKIIQSAAKVIRDSCRSLDMVARIDGDEFAVILVNTDQKEARAIVKRMKEKSKEVVVGRLPLSISFGYSIKENESQTMREVLANAESFVYKHKTYENASMRHQTIDAIMHTLFEKSQLEHLHSERVAGIGAAIAKAMNLDPDKVNKIRVTGQMHDIGKIGIEERILNKEEALNEDEWEKVRKHPEAGWRILSTVKEFSDIARYILYHHERWDGKGYPEGLKEDEIPLESRIISIADAFDAMTKDRSYRSKMSIEDAVGQLKKNAGTQFDPKLVLIFTDQILPLGEKYGII